MARTPSPPPRAPTILDVAEAAGVSKSTVSLVLQGSPLIREETAAKVREVAAKLGYVYNRRAAQLRSQSSNVVGVVINDLMNPFFAEVLVGIERKLAQEGYITFMAHTDEDVALQRKVLHSMREQNAAGIILCPALGTPASLVKEVHGWGIPLLVIIRALGKGGYDYAGSDNALGTFMATAHLLEAGHRRVGFLGGRGGPALDDRLEGYREALRKHGVKEDPALIRPALPTRQGGYDAIRALLALPNTPTAAVCYNDITAFGALAALGERGVTAGRDFAIVGYDGVLDAAHSNPPLTTVDIRPGALGEAAAGLMLQRLADPQAPRLRYIAQPTLLVRASSALAGIGAARHSAR